MMYGENSDARMGRILQACCSDRQGNIQPKNAINNEELSK